MRALKETSVLYAVRIEGLGGPRFACGKDASRALFFTRREANLFCKELGDYIDSKCKVVKVELVIREIIR